MDYEQFTALFPEDTEIGRDLIEETLTIFRDNGQVVGAWVEDRRTTTGRGEILTPENAESARAYFKREKPTWVSRTTDDPPTSRIGKALNTALLLLERDGIARLRGLAWTDTDRELIEDGVRALQEKERTCCPP